MTRFSPKSWKAEGKKVTAAADHLYQVGEGVILEKPIFARTNSQLDQALVSGDGKLYGPWHRLLASAFEGLSALGSKMEAAGGDYELVEEAARQKAAKMVKDRYW